jgi:hypothetical protein
MAKWYYRHTQADNFPKRRLKNDPRRPAWPEMYDWRGLAEVVNRIEQSSNIFQEINRCIVL